MTVSRVWTDRNLVRGVLVSGSQMDTLDANSVRILNGVDGETRVLTGMIEIGGAGVVIAGPSLISQVHTTTDATHHIEFERGTSDDYFGFADDHDGKHPQVGTPFTEFYAKDTFFTTGTSASQFGVQTLDKPPLYMPQEEIEVTEPRRFSVPLNVYNGAPSMGTVILYVTTAVHSAMPKSLPSIRVIAVDSEGNIISLRTPDIVTDENGFLKIGIRIPYLFSGFVPRTVTEWNFGGNVQSFAYICNVNHVVDVGQYSYFMEIIDESGTDSEFGTRYLSAQVCHSDVMIFDGRN